MKSKIRLGILGGGGDSLIGIVHRIASSMHDSYSIIGGVFNPDYSENLKFAKEIGLDETRVYEDYDKMIEEELKLDESERMQVVSILTPNFLTVSREFKITFKDDFSISITTGISNNWVFISLL